MNKLLEEIYIDSKEYFIHNNDRVVIEQQTFYIYTHITNGLRLYIVDGIKTNPPIHPFIAEHDPDNYEKVFTIPKGIIHKHHADWINLDICDSVLYNGKCIIMTERDDEKAKKLYEEYFWRCDICLADT